MTVKIPAILNNSTFMVDESLIQWNADMPGFFSFSVENEKMVDTLWKLNHKATIGLAAALSEWIIWRLSKDRDVSKLINAIEAIWLSLIDKLYLSNWKYSGDKGETIFKNIVWIVFSSHLFIRDNYIKGDYQIQYRIMNLAMLARHVTPDPVMFDTWLDDCFARLTKLFPAQYDRGDVMDHPENYPKYYDSSSEPPIPREFFFEPGFDYEKTNIVELLSKFMEHVDHSNISFFKSPEKMIEKGFIGVPYLYPGI